MRDDLPRRLAEGLSRAASARNATTTIAPALAYGRHHGPAPAGARRAAVAVVWLRRDDGSWWLPLTLRPRFLRHHGGQICFPGGMIEPGETPHQAALREFHEELGHAPVEPRYCGDLAPIYVYASNNLVYPVVYTADAPRSPWDPDPAEVERVIELPLQTLRGDGEALRDTRSRQIVRDQAIVGEYQFDSVAYRVGDDLIWGATAILIHQLEAMVAARQQTALESQ
jgi:8-oxo-dGTP pyrophosphatase MutT (NUDIX family)